MTRTQKATCPSRCCRLVPFMPGRGTGRSRRLTCTQKPKPKPQAGNALKAALFPSAVQAATGHVGMPACRVVLGTLRRTLPSGLGAQCTDLSTAVATSRPLLRVAWAFSARVRNRLAHALQGNVASLRARGLLPQLPPDFHDLPSTLDTQADLETMPPVEITRLIIRSLPVCAVFWSGKPRAVHLGPGVNAVGALLRVLAAHYPGAPNPANLALDGHWVRTPWSLLSGVGWEVLRLPQALIIKAPRWRKRPLTRGTGLLRPCGAKSRRKFGAPRCRPSLPAGMSWQPMGCSGL